MTQNIESLYTQRTTFVILAAALAVALFAVGCGKSDPAKPAEGAKAPAKAPAKGAGEFVPQKEDTKAKAAEAAKTAVFKENGQFLPKPEALKGFALVQGPDYYTKDTLFEQIDGGSDGYIVYGFKQMAKAVYKPTDKKDFKEEINAEIYSFNDFLGAIGKFSEERSGCKDEDKRPENWCLRQSDVIFWKGPYMVKIQTFEDGPVAEEVILKIAESVDGALKEKVVMPEPLTKFPAEGALKGTGGWRVRDMYGFTGLKGGYVKKYRPAGDAYKAEDAAVEAFGVFLDSKEDAQKLFASVQETAKKLVKGKITKIEGVGEDAFIYTDSQGTHTFYIKDQIIGGVRDLKDEATGKTLTKSVADAL